MALAASLASDATATEPPNSLLTLKIDAAGSDSSGPAWVPGAQVVDSHGQLLADVLGTTGLAAVEARSLHLDRLSPSERAMIQSGLDESVAKAPGMVSCSCPIVTTFPSRAGEPRAHANLTEIATNAEDVLVGTVTESAAGFSLATAGVLLRVRVDRSLKGSVAYGSQRELYVFYPHAAFAVGGKVFCGQGWFGADAPEVGSRLIVTPFGEPDGRDLPLIHAEWWELPAFSSASRLHVPDTLARDQLLAGVDEIDTLTQALTAAVASR